MGTKVRDLISTGDAFQGAIRTALGCGPGSEFPAQYRVLSRDNQVRYCCAQHLEPVVREETIRTGSLVAVEFGGCGERKCRYERVPLRVRKGAPARSADRGRGLTGKHGTGNDTKISGSFGI